MARWQTPGLIVGAVLALVAFFALPFLSLQIGAGAGGLTGLNLAYVPGRSQQVTINGVLFWCIPLMAALTLGALIPAIITKARLGAWFWYALIILALAGLVGLFVYFVQLGGGESNPLGSVGASYGFYAAAVGCAIIFFTSASILWRNSVDLKPN